MCEVCRSVVSVSNAMKVQPFKGSEVLQTFEGFIKPSNRPDKILSRYSSVIVVQFELFVDLCHFTLLVKLN